MFSFNDVEELLSSTTRNALNNVDSYNLYSFEAAQIIKENSNVDLTALNDNPEWSKIPFVFILEFLVHNKINVPNADNYIRVKDNYKIAIDICKNHRDVSSITASKVGKIGDDYNVEF